MLTLQLEINRIETRNRHFGYHLMSLMLNPLLPAKVEDGFLKATFRLVNSSRPTNVKNGFPMLV